MKRLFFGLVALFALLVAAPVDVVAQTPPPAPVDEAVRVGTLPNGLTYYIRHNEKPKGQADFFIAQKVGSILEDDNQRGLAHFLEHMCFNGTKNFPGNSLIDWLATVGVKFGQNLNAYTSIDETVYNISSVPVSRTGVQDSCLLILHDWADGLLLDPEEIDKERGVIHQEWRRSNAGMMRLYETLLPVMYPDNKYGERLPIGTMDVVDHFPPQALRDYYEKWYRPDQQGIIVVGDIDPDYIEGKIKEIFADVQMPADAAERTYLDVQDTPGTIYAIGTDKEMPTAIAMIAFKQPEQLLPREFRSTQAFFAVDYLKTMLNMMLAERLGDVAKKPDATFSRAEAAVGDYMLSKTKDALTLEVYGKGNDILPGLQSAYRELLRAARGGFTAAEYDRAKAEYLADLEKQYEQRNGRENTTYCREYVRNFVDGDPIPGIEFELQVAKQLSEMIPVQAINQMLPQLLADDNRVVALFLPEKDDYVVPAEADLAKLIADVEAEDIEAFKEDIKSEPLVENLPAPQTPKVSKNAQWDATELIYGNGARVFLKPTDFKKGEIFFSAIAKGGLSAMQSDASTLQSLPYMMTASGLGSYNKSDLEKYLTGKQTDVDLSIDSYFRELSGSTTPKNIRTLMELIYMNFTGFNITEDDFAATQNRFVAMVENQEKNPDFTFQTKFLESIYKAPAKQFITSKALKEADREETLSIVQQMYSNPGDFTFVFVGDIDVDSLTALCNQYIGSIAAPRVAGIPFVKNPDFEMTVGASTEQDKMAMQTPQTWVAVTVSADMPYTAKNKALSSIAAQVLTKRLLATIREEMGAVYSIGAQADLDRLASQNFNLFVPFPMKPEAKDEVLAKIAELVNGMAAQVTDEELAPIVEFMVKQAAEDQDKNNAWGNAIIGATLNDVDTFNDKADMLKGITTADVQNFMKAALDQNNYRVYVLEPETAE